MTIQSSMVGNIHDRVIRFNTSPSPTPLSVPPSRKGKVITFRGNPSEEEDGDKYVLPPWPYGDYKTALFFLQLVYIRKMVAGGRHRCGEQNAFNSIEFALQAVQ